LNQGGEAQVKPTSKAQVELNQARLRSNHVNSSSYPVEWALIHVELGWANVRLNKFKSMLNSVSPYFESKRIYIMSKQIERNLSQVGCADI